MSLAGTGVKADTSLKPPGGDGIVCGEEKPLDGSTAVGLDGDGSVRALPIENAWISNRAEGSRRVPRANRERQRKGNRKRKNKGDD